MKTLKIAGILLASLFITNCTATEKIVTLEQMPQKAQQFINAHFSERQISYAKLDEGTYEVRFADGTEADFNRKGEWDNVDCQRNAVPASIISLMPAAIQEYVQNNFAGAFIVAIDKDRNGYDIELNTDIDLKFNSKGEFKRVD